MNKITAVVAGLLFAGLSFFVAGLAVEHLDSSYRAEFKRDWRPTKGTVIDSAFQPTDSNPEYGRPLASRDEITTEAAVISRTSIYTDNVRVAYTDWQGEAKQANVSLSGIADPKVEAIIGGTNVTLMVNAKAEIIPNVLVWDPEYDWVKDKFKYLNPGRFVVAIFGFLLGYGASDRLLLRLSRKPLPVDTFEVSKP